MSWVRELARPDILALAAYDHASWQESFTRLHANELPWRAPDDESVAGLNRYPEPLPRVLIERLAALYGASCGSLLVCRGSDDAIDLLVRTFCRADEDAVLVCPPTFGMYGVAARIQGAGLVSVPLLAARGFELDVEAVQAEAADPRVKLVFLCSPNNPTGNLLHEESILAVADAFEGRGLVIVDEAYIEFSHQESLVREIARRPQLIILRTLSKAHGLAGARLGALVAHPEVIALVRKVIPPYAVPQLIVETVLTLLSPTHLRTLPHRLRRLRAERTRLQQALTALPTVREVFPSETNFLLVRLDDGGAALARAAAARLLVRDVRSCPALPDALRITVGTPEQNDALLKAWA